MKIARNNHEKWLAYNSAKNLLNKVDLNVGHHKLIKPETELYTVKNKDEASFDNKFEEVLM